MSAPNGIYELAIDVPDHMVAEGVNRLVFTSDMEHFQIEKLLELAIISLDQRLDALRNCQCKSKPVPGDKKAPDRIGLMGSSGEVPIYGEDLAAMITAAEKRLAAAWDLRAVFAGKSLVHVRRPDGEEEES